MKKFLPCFLLLLFLSPIAMAQATVPEAWYASRQDLVLWGSLVLAIWAMGNIALSSLSLPKASRNKRYFHQMNIIWNILNLGLAGSGAYRSLSNGHAAASLSGALQEHALLTGGLLLLTGLNVAYILLGLYLQERAHRAMKPDRLEGYGQSLVLQGTFLLFFDITLYFILHNQGAELYNLLANLQFPRPTLFG